MQIRVGILPAVVVKLLFRNLVRARLDPDNQLLLRLPCGRDLRQE
ncbi:hypothetical protein [Hymenobacter sp. DG25B]|nr:hypothetical protein [Hymenobacter sp. DG25B]